ncbi:MAG TPA: L,D-transpeptidase [Burkholderiaceae bacterium]|jgi:hypothetical protein
MTHSVKVAVTASFGLARNLLTTALTIVLFLAMPESAFAGLPSDQQSLMAFFEQRLPLHVPVPENEQAFYAQKLDAALLAAGVTDLEVQYVVVIDRNPKVQLALIYRGNSHGAWQFLVALPVSTGKPGRFDHFVTPLGVFSHTPQNMDFRAEGTMNSQGIRGYGEKGMRVFDFGWVAGQRGWGKRDVGIMRLQMHATDPDFLAQRLGRPDSKGCVRIPAELNRMIDHYGLLDADYDQLLERGQHLWILDPNREPVPDAGRYLVVIDSQLDQRPAWMSPLNGAHR